MSNGPPAQKKREVDTPTGTSRRRRTTDVHAEASAQASDHLSDVIRAVGFKLAAALPESENAQKLARTLSVSDLALLLPDWASAVTSRANGSKQDAGHLLRQVCGELEGPLDHLQRTTAQRLQSDVDLEGLRFVEDVQLAAQRLRRLTNDLLDLAGISGGDFAIARLRFQLRDCVAAALDELRTRARRRGSTLVVEVGPEVPGCLIGDPGRLRQVVATLVGNAVAGSNHDEIRLSLTAQLEQGRIVQLRGVISRIDGATSAATGLRRRRHDSGATTWLGDASTGLGLAISRELVAKMGGRTWVEGGIDGGSLLNFTVRCELASANSDGWSGSERSATPRILLTSPEGEAIAEIQDGLRALNATVTVLHHPDKVARAIADNPGGFDVIIMVASLTSRRGSALAEAVGFIKDKPPVALITRAGHRGDATRCRRLGVTAYLPQPVSRRDLDDTLRAMASAAAEAEQSGKRSRLLITRHFLRETRRRLHIAVVGDVMDVVATLRGLGHSVHVVASEAGEAGEAAAEPPDVLVVGLSASTTAPRALVAAGLRDVGGTPAVLALVRDPATPGLSPRSQLGILARRHDTTALQEALRRLRNTGGDADSVAAEAVGEGPSIWPMVVRRTEGDEDLARGLIEVFVAYAPNWVVAIDRSLRDAAAAPAYVAFDQLRTALEVLDLRAPAQLCARLEAAERAGRGAQTEALVLELKGQMNQIIAQMRAILARRRYTVQPND